MIQFIEWSDILTTRPKRYDRIFSWYGWTGILRLSIAWIPRGGKLEKLESTLRQKRKARLKCRNLSQMYITNKTLLYLDF
jgi:hypothetical protein